MSNRLSGFFTLEILIAFAITTSSIVAAMVIVFGSQNVSIDSQTNAESLFFAQSSLQQLRSVAEQNFGQVLSTPAQVYNSIYTQKITAAQNTLTQCGKGVTFSMQWDGQNNALESTELLGNFFDRATAVSLGGRCDASAPTGLWQSLVSFGSQTLSPASPLSENMFNGFTYVGADEAPYLFIANVAASAPGSNNGMFFSFANNFSETTAINDLVVARYPSGKLYAFTARDSTTKQLGVLDLTDPHNPVLLATHSLAGVSSTGSFPQGFRIYFFDQKIFIVTRFTAGPELHIFNVADPANPLEIGSGTDLGRTVEDMVISRKNILGTNHYYLYFASDKNSAPLSVYDVTFPSANTSHVSELTSAEPLFFKYQDGQSLFLLGDHLYFGRSSDPLGPDLFVYDTSNPSSGAALPLLTQTDIGATVLDVFISGNFAFVTTPKVNKELQIWKADPANITLVSLLHEPSLINRGLEYFNNRLLIAGSGGDMQIIQSQ